MTTDYNEHFINKLISDAQQKAAFDYVLVFMPALADYCTGDKNSILYLDIEKMKYGREEYEALCERICMIDGTALIITDKAHLFLTNRILWECKNVTSSICIDSEDPYPVEASVSRSDYLLWDFRIKKAEKDDFAFMSGWSNSYNLRKFTQDELDEYVHDAFAKISPLIDQTSRVLEVGIGSGMIAYPLIPLCKQYDGCDFSQQALAVLKNRIEQSGFTNVNLYKLSADEIHELPGVYDCILMSSVTEYFSGYNYMREVVNQCIKKIDGKGEVFLLDVFDLDRLADYKESVAEYAKQHPMEKHKTEFYHELYFPRNYWSSLQASVPGIKEVKVTDKLGVINNEINRYRYDVQITVDKEVAVDPSRCFKPQFGVSG